VNIHRIAGMVIAIAGLLAVRADARPMPVTPWVLSGTIDRLIYGLTALPEGILLRDHTLVKLASGANAGSQGAARLKAGDAVSVRGNLILSRPNHVLDRAVLTRNGQAIFDESTQAIPRAPNAAAGTGISFQPMSKSSILIAASARANGQIDRLILQDGTIAQIPPKAYVLPRQLYLGQRISVQGIGEPLRHGSFIEVMTLRGASQAATLTLRGVDGEKWTVKNGRIRQPLLTPSGEVDGVLLGDGSAIRFRPIALSEARSFAKGEEVRAAGIPNGNQLRSDLIMLPRQALVYGFIADNGDALAPALAGQVASAALVPLQDSARIQSILYATSAETSVTKSAGPSVRVEKLVLSDGVVVSLTPQAQLALNAPDSGILRVGDPILVIGVGGSYSAGTAIEASTIRAG
jgi:hypothetical protein